MAFLAIVFKRSVCRGNGAGAEVRGAAKGEHVESVSEGQRHRDQCQNRPGSRKPIRLLVVVDVDPVGSRLAVFSQIRCHLPLQLNEESYERITIKIGVRGNYPHLMLPVLQRCEDVYRQQHGDRHGHRNVKR